MSTPPKYPRTPYWYLSPSKIANEDDSHGVSVLVGMHNFINTDVIITEKLDGGNVLLHDGDVYARSTSGGPAVSSPWLGMVKKHHAWKTKGSNLFIYGEDIYGVHSIEYDAILETNTFYIFAIRDGDLFLSFEDTVKIAKELDIGMVPVVFKGQFEDLNDINKYMGSTHYYEKSALGGNREGLVMRIADSFYDVDFQHYVCKSVRYGHVQSDEHWRRNWKPCKIKK